VKLSISNIAWSAEHDEEMYDFLHENAIHGLEIAPTRIFTSQPYNNISQAKDFGSRLIEKYNMAVSSVQSIWYGLSENIFESETSRKVLIDYAKKAIDFASALKCGNIVFGCPKNRSIPSNMSADTYLPIAYDFFKQIGDYADANGTCIAIEPNPVIYSTNFINTTTEAFEVCRKIDNPGVKVNVDIGTIVYYEEQIGILEDNVDLINHVHISEPRLVPIEKRLIHIDLIKMLRNLNYSKFFSIEMANQNDADLIKQTILYVKGLLQ
jgi:sugar phosphate isomerase/epimerase